MKPQISALLSRVLALAEQSLARPSGDPRRQAEAEKLFDEIAAAKEWGTDEPKRYVNDWTAMLVTLLRKIERLGPYGDRDDLARAVTLAHALLPYVKADASAALDVVARAGREAV